MTEEELVNKNIGLVKTIVKSFNPPNITVAEEYYSCGLVGLLKAVRCHNKKRGKLSTVAWTIICREIIKHINSNKEIVLIEQKDSSNINFNDFLPYLTKEEENLIRLKLEEYTLKEISEKLDVSIGKIHYKLKKIYKKIQVANRFEY